MKRIVFTLITMLLVAAAVAACTSETGPPAESPATPTPTPTSTPTPTLTPTPTPTPESAGAAIEALTQQVGNLANQVEALAASNETLASQLGATPASSTSPPAASAPAPTGSGICGRTPELQRYILDKLRLASCRIVITEELYRITELSTFSWDEPPSPGDFAGLVNLQGYEVRQSTGSDFKERDFKLPLGTFSGMTGLKTLRVEVSGWEEGAFQGLPELEWLDISLRPRYDMMDYPGVLQLPVFDEVPNLKRLEIDSGSLSYYGWLLEITPGPFDNLPNLEELKIEWAWPGRHADDFRRTFHLPAGLFQHNPGLRVVEIRIHGGGPSIMAPVDLFAGLDYLESLTIYSSNWQGTVPLALSTKSPLFNELINGDGQAERNGYSVVWPE